MPSSVLFLLQVDISFYPQLAGFSRAAVPFCIMISSAWVIWCLPPCQCWSLALPGLPSAACPWWVLHVLMWNVFHVLVVRCLSVSFALLSADCLIFLLQSFGTLFVYKVCTLSFHPFYRSCCKSRSFSFGWNQIYWFFFFLLSPHPPFRPLMSEDSLSVARSQRYSGFGSFPLLPNVHKFYVFTF